MMKQLMLKKEVVIYLFVCLLILILLFSRACLHINDRYVCRALVYISHGVAEYMGRYEQLGRTLSENGILTVGHDHGT